MRTSRVPAPRTLRAIVNADDLGLSPAIDDAVFSALEAGLCTSASVLANGPSADDALRRARGFAHRGFGVHLCLTELAPLTAAAAPLFRRLAERGGKPELLPGDQDALFAEWSAQVRRALDAGVPLDHLDSHQHVHQLPAALPVLVALKRRFGVSRLRGMSALRPGLPARAFAQRLRAARFRRRIRSAGFATPDGFASLSAFLQVEPPPWGTVELMVHPGNPHHGRYAEELAALAAGRLDALPVRVERIRWSDLPTTSR